MTGTIRHIALAIALAVLAATLAACGGYDEPTPTPRPQTAATPTPRVIIQEPSAPTATPAPPSDQGVIGGTNNPNAAPYDLTFFEHSGVNPFIDTEDDRLSTFAIDVDTASYTVARRFVRDGNLPDPASVRVEEFVNFFDHDYAPPTRDPFAIHVEGSPPRSAARTTGSCASASRPARSASGSARTPRSSSPSTSPARWDAKTASAS